MDDLLREFLTETTESMGQLDAQLVRLEQDPNDPELLSSIFRLVHTIKGTCGFLGLPRLEHVAHAAENVLGKFRDKELPVTPGAVTLIFRSLDTIKSLLTALEETGTEPAGHDEELIAYINAMANGPGAGPSHSPNESDLEAAFANAPVAAEAPQVPEPSREEPQLQAVVTVTVTEAPADAHAEAPAGPLAEHAVPGAPGAGADRVAKDGGVSAQSIRVDVSLLENLMTTVSELVLTRNQLLQILRAQKETQFAAPLQRLNQVTTELQEGVMKTRMQPIGNAWQKLPRIIRDLSVELGKKIDLQMIGQDTELDRQVLELIKDPLTHMVRNSADHGIETPEERRKAGKSETGTIKLHAYHQGGHIIIEISDDGKGLALARIRAKALQNRLVTEDELAAMAEQQVMQFIFKAGFSTAAKVTSVSGRGVGMDVVRTNIEKIGGTIILQSTEGKGSSFLIKIPLTLAIVSSLILECGRERFALPQLNVIELVHGSKDGEHRVEQINNTLVLRLRNRLLPLVSLDAALRLGADRSVGGLSSIIVVQAGGAVFGIIVDRVFDTEEIVVKPVSPLLSNIPAFSGNTILGDGSVVMILDPNGFAPKAAELDASAETEATAAEAKSKANGWQSLLLFYAGDATPKAIPLSLIARLEYVDRKLIEHSNYSPMIQYRGTLMPLISLSDTAAASNEGVQPVIVFSDGPRNVGVLADSIIDIVEEQVTITGLGARPGCLGSAVICGKATDIVDVAYRLGDVFKGWQDEPSDSGRPAEQRLLLVDDSLFFRNLLVPYLETNGYAVTAVASPSAALKLHDSGASFDAIISDLDMPGTSGLDFATMIRRDGRWQTVPLLALSARSRDDGNRLRDVGFTDFVGKFDREQVVSVLHKILDHPPEVHA